MTFLYTSPSFTTTDRDEFDQLFGFKPTRKARVVKAPKRIPQKPFTPKSGDPGTLVQAGGRSFEVWSGAPFKGTVWAIPVDARDGDAQVYLVEPGYTATPHHADGSVCAPHVWFKDRERTSGTWQSPRSERHEEPCRHRSHHE